MRIYFNCTRRGYPPFSIKLHWFLCPSDPFNFDQLNPRYYGLIFSDRFNDLKPKTHSIGDSSRAYRRAENGGRNAHVSYAINQTLDLILSDEYAAYSFNLFCRGKKLRPKECIQCVRGIKISVCLLRTGCLRPLQGLEVLLRWLMVCSVDLLCWILTEYLNKTDASL